MKTIKELIDMPESTLLDVRSEGEFQSFSIDGSINIPVDQIPERIDEIKAMSQPIVVYCLSGGRSSSALQYLKQNGINEVYNAGGVADVRMMTL